MLPVVAVESVGALGTSRLVKLLHTLVPFCNHDNQNDTRLKNKLIRVFGITLNFFPLN